MSAGRHATNCEQILKAQGKEKIINKAGFDEIGR